MNKKKLVIILLIVLIISLISLFIWVGQKSSKTNIKENKFVSNTGVVYSQGNNILE